MRRSSPARASPTISRQAPGRSGRGHDAEPGLGVADLEGRRSDPQIRGVREFGAAPERVPVDRGDHGHRQLVDADERSGVDPFARVGRPALPKLRDVGT